MIQKKIIDATTRERIFGLYAAQKIMTSDSFYSDGGIDHYETPVLSLAKYSGMFLKVKPLYNLSQKDAIEVTEVINCGDEYRKSVVKALLKSIRNGVDILYFFDKNREGFNGSMCIEVIDLLRSKGYALPAFGFSVEELYKQHVFWSPEELRTGMSEKINNESIDLVLNV